MLGYYAVAAVTTAALLVWAHQQPHATAPSEADTPAPATAPLSPKQATSSFPPADIAKFRTITADTLAKLNSGNQAAATTRVTDLETAWDDAQPTLEPRNGQAWHFLDGEIDHVLKALRATRPDKATEATSSTPSSPRSTPERPPRSGNQCSAALILRGREQAGEKSGPLSCKRCRSPDVLAVDFGIVMQSGFVD